MKNVFKKIHLILTIQCDKAAQLTSESLERKLRLHERLAIRGHQLGCWSCRQFEKQLRFMRNALRHLKEDETADGQAVSVDPAFKQRLKSLRVSDKPQP